VRGRKPLPTYLKLLSGNAGRRPINDAEPIPEGDLVAAPEWMTEEQRKVWDVAIADAPPGLLRRLDASILVVWVIAKDLHRDASEKIARYGAVIKAPGSGIPMQSPYVGVLNRQAQIMLKAASEMGFSPSSRSRVKVEGRKPGAKGNKFADLQELGDE
jgi:P27 family predicted phage terminase small subunit